MKRISTIVLVVAIPLSLLAQPSLINQSGAITVQMIGFKSDKGQVAVSLYATKDGFPLDADKAVRKKTSNIRDRKSIVVFENVPFGEYAVSYFHDEDDNGEMKTNFLGIPREGVGVSRNAKGRFGPPKWKDAVFEMSQPATTMVLTIEYL